MTVNIYSTTQSENNMFSAEYYEKFIADDKTDFYENKYYINSVLKPEVDNKYLEQVSKSYDRYNAQNKYKSIFLQKERLIQNIKELENKQKQKEEQVRNDCLKQGLSINEANEEGRNAGLQYKKQIDNINYYQKPVVSEAFNNSSEKLTEANNKYYIARNQYLSSDLELSNSLFSQTNLAMNINFKTTQWYGMIVKEIKLAEINNSK